MIRIFEFGSFCGVLILYFVDVLWMLGCGVVIVIEGDVFKCVCLCDYVEIVGLEVYVDVWEGDVFDMVVGLDGIVDMVFIDVWVDVYLKLFK